MANPATAHQLSTIPKHDDCTDVWTWGDRFNYPMNDPRFRIELLSVGGGKSDKLTTKGDDLKYFATKIIGDYGAKWACDLIKIDRWDNESCHATYKFWYMHPETNEKHEFTMVRPIILTKSSWKNESDILDATKIVGRRQGNYSPQVKILETDEHSFSTDHTYAVKRGLELIGFCRNIQLQGIPCSNNLNLSAIQQALGGEQTPLDVKKTWYEPTLRRCKTEKERRVVEFMFKTYVFDAIDSQQATNYQPLAGGQENGQ